MLINYLVVVMNAYFGTKMMDILIILFVFLLALILIVMICLVFTIVPYWSYLPMCDYYDPDKSSFNCSGVNPFGEHYEKPIPYTCGKCRTCRARKVRDWIVRCYYEAKVNRPVAVALLTYNEGNLPPYGLLRYDDLILFKKRLRKNYGFDLRTFDCAEYGDVKGRPHFHVVFFGEFFDLTGRKTFWKNQRCFVYVPELAKCWGHGFVWVQAIDPLGFTDLIVYLSGYWFKNIALPKYSRAKKQFCSLFETGHVYYTSRAFKVYRLYKKQVRLMDGRERLTFSKGIGWQGFLNNLDAIKRYGITINGSDYSVPIYWLKKLAATGDSWANDQLLDLWTRWLNEPPRAANIDVYERYTKTRNVWADL